jgi:hypothetical protein
MEEYLKQHSGEVARLREIAKDYRQDPERWIKQHRRLVVEFDTEPWIAIEILEENAYCTGQPEPPTPSRCAICRQPYDNPMYGCKAPVHQGKESEPPWVPTHRTRECITTPTENSDSAEYREIERAHRKAIHDAFRSGLQLLPQTEPWPCKEHDFVPLERSVLGSNDLWSIECPIFDCLAVVYGNPLLQARAEWNKRFGRAPKANDYPKKINSWHVFVSDGTECCNGCRSHLIYMDEVWKRDELKLCRLCASNWNPHDLTHCSCGKIPRPVAFLYSPGLWQWAVECCGQRSVGLFVFRGNLGLDRPMESDAVRRYDIPTHVTLGCPKLPKEYQVETTLR